MKIWKNELDINFYLLIRTEVNYVDNPRTKYCWNKFNVSDIISNHFMLSHRIIWKFHPTKNFIYIARYLILFIIIYVKLTESKLWRRWKNCINYFCAAFVFLFFIEMLSFSLMQIGRCKIYNRLRARYNVKREGSEMFRVVFL